MSDMTLPELYAWANELQPGFDQECIDPKEALEVIAGHGFSDEEGGNVESPGGSLDLSYLRLWSLLPTRAPIRRRQHGQCSRRALAGAFGVSQPTITCIVNYQTWRHLP